MIRLQAGWRPILALGAGAGLLLSPLAASADIGTGVGANPIQLPNPVDAGHVYTMPQLYVVNTGTQAATYSVKVQALAQTGGQTVPAAWIEFGKNDFQLQPKESTVVPIKLDLPNGAPSGSYSSDLLVGTVTPGQQAGGATVGAAAAAKLSFSVAKPGPHIPWPWPWWAYLAAGAALLGSGGALAIRRLGLRLQLERRV